MKTKNIRPKLVIAACLSAIAIAAVGPANRVSAAPKEAVGESSGIPQTDKINERIRVQWKDFEITPSSKASDGQWCRRVYLDIIGRIPSTDELQAFLNYKGSGSTSRKEWLVETLLHDEKYTEEYARNWTTEWTNILIGRNGGNERNSLTSRAGLQKYLRDSFARNKPYDRMVYELVTATGVNTPGKANFNGAVNFLAMKVNEEKATLATAATSKTFLGLQVQCTQCHNHPFNEWKQQKFWEFNAFFRQTRMLRRYVDGTNDIEYAELVDEDFAGEFGNPEQAVTFYELRNGLTMSAYPVFIDGREVGSRSGFVEDVNRRQELAKFMMDSEFLDKMIVNRMWAHFMGYGFTKPIDDLGPHNPATHPELLGYLGTEFRNNSYDLKELIRWIVLSEPYSLSSEINSTNVLDDPQLGETPKFSRFYLRQMTAEQLYESLLVATQAHKTQSSYEEQEKTKNEWLRQFVIAFGTDEGDETTTFNGSIPQALMLFNGDLIKKATSSEKGSFLWNVANGKMDGPEQVKHLFLAGLARNPTKDEVEIARKLFVARKGDATATLQDLWWAILNSNEFIINH